MKPNFQFGNRFISNDSNPIRLNLSDSQKELVKHVESFAQKTILPLADKIDKENNFPHVFPNYIFPFFFFFFL